MTAVAWVGEGVQALRAHSEVTVVAVLNLGEVEAVVAADPLHPYDLVSQVETTTSDHDLKKNGRSLKCKLSFMKNKNSNFDNLLNLILNFLLKELFINVTSMKIFLVIFT